MPKIIGHVLSKYLSDV